MPHSITFDSMDEVPEGLRYEGLKAGEDGKVSIPVVPKVKVDEFRDNNIKVSQERDNFKSKTDTLKAVVGDDVDAFKAELDELRVIQKKVKDGELQVTEKVQEEVDSRVAEMKRAYEEALETERKKSASERKRADNLDLTMKAKQIETMITQAALRPESGVKPSAIKNLVKDAQDVYVFPEGGGDPVPKRNGVTLYGEDGTSVMSDAEWIASQVKVSDHYFKRSGGGDAAGGDKPASIGNLSADEFNALSARQRLELANQQAAAGGNRNRR